MTNASHTTIDRLHAALDFSAFIPVIFAAIIGIFITATVVMEHTGGRLAANTVEQSEG